MIDNLDFEKICSKLKNKENFTFSRIASDGELNCIFQKEGQNCDKHPYHKDMGDKLRSIINTPQRYYLGLQSLAYNQRKDQIDEIATRMNHRWCNADILHHASINGDFEKMMTALEGRDIIFVAPKRLEGLKDVFPEVFGYYKHILIPDVNCWSEYEHVKQSIRRSIHKKDMVILYCASMMTKVLIDNIFEQHLETITQIDCGSVFEPYVGVSNRTYHKNIINRLKP